MILDPQHPVAQSLLHLTARDVLLRVTGRLSSGGVVALPVKGVVTAHTLYAEPSERPIADVDLRVEPSAVTRARRIGLEAGWKMLAYSPAYYNVVFEVAGLMVDIEGTVGPPGLCALSVREMIARAETSRDGYLIPELHDHALLLVVNAFKDKLVRAASWSLEDLGRIVRSSGFTVDTFVLRVSRAKVVALAWFVADWLARTRGDEMWSAIKERLSARPPRPLYLRALATCIERSPDGLATRILARVASDDASQWTSALARAAVWQARALVRPNSE